MLIGNDEEKKLLVEAMVAFHSEVGNVEKDGRVERESRGGAAFRFKYATLTAVLGAVRELLSKNGLFVAQEIVQDEDLRRITVRSVLYHVGGASLVCQATMPVEDWKPQALGSLTTYLRRYTLLSLLCVATEDDNGESAVAPTRTAPRRSTASPPQKADGPSEAMLKKIAALGGDVEKARAMSYESAIQYGKQLRAQADAQEDAEPGEGAAIPTELEPETELDPTSVMGLILDHKFGKNVLKVTLDTGVRVAIFQSRAMMWALMVKRGADGVATLAVQSDERVLFTGKMKRDEKFGDEFIADNVTISDKG